MSSCRPTTVLENNAIGEEEEGRSFTFESDTWDLNLFVGPGLEPEFLDLLWGLVELDHDLPEVLHAGARPDLRREFLAVAVDRDEPHWLVLDVMSDR